MTKREKVIDDLEEQIVWIRDNDFHKFPGWGHAVLAMHDAIALLKAQEPLNPVPSDRYVRTELVTFDYKCVVCNAGLVRHWVCCPCCGQAVKWE